MAYPTERLFVQCFQIELEFKSHFIVRPFISTRAVEKILFAQLQLAKLAKSKLIRFNAEHWVRPVLVPFVGLMDTVKY